MVNLALCQLRTEVLRRLLYISRTPALILDSFRQELMQLRFQQQVRIDCILRPQDW
jgi:hypothetical protein